MKINRIVLLRIPPFFGYILHHPHDITLPFTLGYIATSLQQNGYQVEVVDVWANGWSLDKTLNFILNFDPQVIIYDANTGVIPTLQQLQAKISQKTQSRKTVSELPLTSIVFGSVATYFPDALFNKENNKKVNKEINIKLNHIETSHTHFDIGLSGECEQTALDVISALEHDSDLNTIPGVVFWDALSQKTQKTAERTYLKDLDKLPIIDYSLFKLAYYRKYSFPVPIFTSVRWGHVLSTRGCPYKCAFCSHDHRQSFGKLVRRYSPQRLADEFEILVKQHQINAISIEDDIFTINRDYVFNFCSELDKRQLNAKWVVQTRADVLDKTLMKRMKTSGCIGLSLGIESGNDRILTLLKKETNTAQIKQTLKSASEVGLMLRLMFMIGNPTETEAEIEDTRQLALQTNAITVQMHYCTPYPGTDFFDPTKDSLQSLADYSSYNRIYRNMSQVSDERLNELRNDFYHSYYFSWKYLKLFMRQRLIYMIAQARDEIPFILKSLWFLVKKPRSQKTRIAADYTD
jgi:anaerobic magnesium-protoporphyrin IX monomethyl ester cyclase